MKDNNIKQLWELFIEEYQKYFLSNNDVWIQKLNKLKIYIDENNKRPPINDKNKDIKQMAQFISDQQINYTKKIHIMKDNDIIKLWEQFIEEYSKYFLDNITQWNCILEKVKEYIDVHKKRPSSKDKNKDIMKLGCWIGYQKQTYIKKEHLMKDNNIRQLWEQFNEKYSEYFIDNITQWMYNLEQIKNYINENNKKPSTESKNKDIKHLRRWLSHQKEQYKIQDRIMKDENIRKLWEKFIEEYQEYLVSNNDIWIQNLNNLKNYIDKYNKLPSRNNKNKDIKHLGKWISYQNTNYKQYKHIMKDNNIRKLFVDFITDLLYNKYFQNIEIHAIDKLKTLNVDDTI